MFKRIIIAAAVVSTSTLAAVAPAHADAAPSVKLAVCRDSNGSRPGGSVYVIDGRSLGCDVQRPQRLHVTRVASLERCDHMGGRYAPAVRVCFDIDY